VHLDPALVDRVFDAGAEFGSGSIPAAPRQERRVDFLDVNAAVLNCLRKGEELIASVDSARRLLSADYAGHREGGRVKVLDRNAVTILG